MRVWDDQNNQILDILTMCDKMQSLPKFMHVERWGLEVKVTFVSSILVISLGLTQRIAGRVVQTATNKQLRQLCVELWSYWLEECICVSNRGEYVVIELG